MSADGPTFLADSALRTVALGAAGLGLVAGSVGSFAVLRRQSLQGDAVSHAALPGVAAAFLLGARDPALLVLGGAAAGWAAMAVVNGVVRRSRVPFDAALGGALAVFFGLGLALMTYVQRHGTGPDRNALERYLFGQAALLGDADFAAIAAAGGAAVVLLGGLWKEFKLLGFDPAYAASLCRPVWAFELLLTSLTVLAVVIGLQAVGVVLMSALLVAPAVAARQCTNRLERMVPLAGLFGATAGFAGTVVAHALSGPGRTVPTGPAIVLCATALVGAALVFGPARGLAWEWGRRSAQKPA